MKNVVSIQLLPVVGAFAQNKDKARMIRLEQIMPALEAGQDVRLDFTGVESTTQSFIHALVSEVMRVYGADVLDRVDFKGCNETVQKIIGIVVDYMQQSDAAKS